MEDWGVFWFGFAVTAVLLVCRIPGSILWGILAAAGLAAGLGKLATPEVIVGLPRESAMWQLDIVGALTLQCFLFIFVFVYMDIFDTMGTLIGVSEQAGLM